MSVTTIGENMQFKQPIKGTVIFNGEHMLEGLQPTKKTELKPLTLEEVRSIKKRLEYSLQRSSHANDSVVRQQVDHLVYTAESLWEEKLTREVDHG
jgi:hypothetical protein